MAKAKLKMHHGAPAIMIDGVPYPPMGVTVRTRNGGAKEPLDVEYFRALGQAGIRLFYVFCDTQWLYDCAEDTFDYEASTILSVVPDAYIIPRISLHPTKQWMEEHPEEVVCYSDGVLVETDFRTETYADKLPGMYSLCSRAWREAAGEALLSMLRFFDTLPYRDRIIGVFLAAGGTSEWYYCNPIENFRTGAYGDTSAAFAEEFSAYLKETYGDKAPAPVIPGLESRYYTEELDRDLFHLPVVRPAEPAPKPPKRVGHIGSFLDMDKFPLTYDFYRAWHLGTANSILYFAKLVKEYDKDKLVGAFYGSFGWSEVIWASNAGGVMKLLDSPYIDFCSNPGVYENRQPGGFTGQRQMPDSFRLHGKMYVVEEDTRTHAENTFFGDLAEMFTEENTLEVLKRDFGRNLCEDLHAWWFDQHIGGGRYKFPAVYELFRKQQCLASEAYEQDRTKNSEIALIYDEESIHVVSKQTTEETVELFRGYELAKIGAPVDQYYHNDLSDPGMPDYKLYVFFNCFCLTQAEREAIQRKLAKNHATALFVYAPGIIDPKADTKFSPAYAEELTGIRCTLLEDKMSPAFCVREDAIPYTEAGRVYGIFDHVQKCNISYNQRHLYRSYLYPALLPCEGEGEVLASFCENGAPAITRKEHKGYTAVFYGAKLLTADMVRGFAKAAGCHIYEEEAHVLYANRSYVTVHAAHTARVTLRFPQPVHAVEVYEQREYAKEQTEFSFPMRRGQTKTFRLFDKT